MNTKLKRVTNKEFIEKKISNLNGGYVLGCYNKEIELLPKEEVWKVCCNLQEDWTDVNVTANGIDYIVEIKTVDNEKDLDILTAKEHLKRYGETSKNKRNS